MIVDVVVVGDVDVAGGGIVIERSLTASMTLLVIKYENPDHAPDHVDVFSTPSPSPATSTSPTPTTSTH